MSNEHDNVRREIDELEAELAKPDLLGIVRRALEEKLLALQAQLELTRFGASAALMQQGHAQIQDNARIYGPTVGANLGTIIYNGVPTDEQREHVVRYLERVSRKMQRLRLGGLSPLDDRGMQLPNVYIMLATDDVVTLKTTNHYAAYASSEAFKEVNPEYVLPDKAAVHVVGMDASGAVLYRSLLVTEAVHNQQQLVLLGAPGGGKSTFLHHLAWAVAERGLDQMSDATALFGWGDERRFLPVLLPLRKLAGRIAKDGASVATVSAALRDEMTQEYDARHADQVLDKALANGAALLLFDGLDEVPLHAVPDQTTDRITTLRAVREFAELHGGARAVVTCRTRAFDEGLHTCLDWHVEQIAPFTLGQMRHFARQWYAELVVRGSLDHEQAERQQQMLINAVVEQPKLRAMAGTPLLLTMIALVLHDKGELPRDRSQLYERILEQLLGVWDQQKDGRSFAQVIGDDRVHSDVLRPVLDQVSFDAHAAASSQDGRGRIPGDKLLLELTKTLDTVRVADPYNAAKRCLHYFEERSGLLVPEDDGTQYTFAHLTLQEYCAGRHLLRQPKATSLVMHRRVDDRWWEPIILYVGVIHKQYDVLADRIETVLMRLLDPEEEGRPKTTEQWYRDLIFAAEIGADRDWDLLRPLIAVDRIQRDLREGLVILLNDKTQPLPVAQRGQAGFLLGDLGDPRFPVTIQEWQREIERGWAGNTTGYFCRVESGQYIIGNNNDPDATDDEKPQHTITISEPFLIARYPITNHQYQAWVQATGKALSDKDNAGLNRHNQPVNIKWYVCNDFSVWLSEETAATVRLPTEYEWEAAARGGDARRFPWGDTWQDDRAATTEDKEARGRNFTMPVGCYPAGTSPCGVLDMAGNIGEWTASIWHAYMGADQAFTNDLVQVVRGGGYYDNKRDVRCSTRFRYYPNTSVFGFRVIVAPRPTTAI